MAEIIKEDIIDPKELKIGNYINVGDEVERKIAQVIDVYSVKNGKHGAAKVTVMSKLLKTNANNQKQFTSSDKVYVYQPVKSVKRLVDLDGTTATFEAEGNDYETIDLEHVMDAADIEKIQKCVSEAPDAESYEICLRALPEFYKLDSIKQGRGN
jgi:translation elongation factor P/translation initiation factor 5A